jgi:hypothetical protein
MTDKISEARQALRDYARRKVTVYTPPDPTSFTGQPGAKEVQFGELVGKAFMAAQAALTVVEELRAEGTASITRELAERFTFEGAQAYKHVQREAADRIEAAILKALA